MCAIIWIYFQEYFKPSIVVFSYQLTCVQHICNPPCNFPITVSILQVYNDKIYSHYIYTWICTSLQTGRKGDYFNSSNNTVVKTVSIVVNRCGLSFSHWIPCSHPIFTLFPTGLTKGLPYPRGSHILYQFLMLAHHPDGGGSECLWNVSKLLPDNMAHPRRQLSSSKNSYLITMILCKKLSLSLNTMAVP